MNDDTDYTSYAFQYTDCDGKVYNTTINNPGPTWTEALNDYVRFLESVFQYDIMSKVRIQEPKYLDVMYEHYPYYDDPWKGEYFNDDEVNHEDFWSEEE